MYNMFIWSDNLEIINNSPTWYVIKLWKCKVILFTLLFVTIFLVPSCLIVKCFSLSVYSVIIFDITSINILGVPKKVTRLITEQKAFVQSSKLLCLQVKMITHALFLN